MLMDKPLHARVLGPQTVREMLFYALHEGGGLDAAGASPIAATMWPDSPGAAAWIESRYADNLTSWRSWPGGELMSVSAFHHHFKAVTATSPPQ